MRQDDETHLERTLTALATLYEQGGREVRREIRGLVIAARQHAEWAAKSTQAGPERRALKLEMLLWIRTWLENPPLFPRWAELRKRLRNPS